MMDTAERKGEDLQVVTFKLGDEEFSVDILKVQEIIKPTEITRVPNAPHFVEGVINLRGRIVPVIDLRKRFGLPVVERDEDVRIIVVNSGGKLIGLIVDSVSQVLRLPQSTVEPPPPMVTSIGSEYIEGIGKLEERLVILLNIDKVLTKEEKDALKGVELESSIE